VNFSTSLATRRPEVRIPSRPPNYHPAFNHLHVPRQNLKRAMTTHDLESVVLFSANQILTLGSPEELDRHHNACCRTRISVVELANRKARDAGEDVDDSARRVVDAKRDSREGDFAARESGVPAFRSSARGSETWSRFITERW
jgi:hypothetical protein